MVGGKARKELAVALCRSVGRGYDLVQVLQDCAHLPARHGFPPLYKSRLSYNAEKRAK